MSDISPLAAADAPRQTIFETDSGAALYIDGALVKTGAFLDVARASLEAAGVSVDNSSDFLLGKSPKSAREFKAAAAASLADVAQFVEIRAKITDLRIRAEALEAEAAALEASLSNGAPAISDQDPLGIGDVPAFDERAETPEEQA